MTFHILLCPNLGHFDHLHSNTIFLTHGHSINIEILKAKVSNDDEFCGLTIFSFLLSVGALYGSVAAAFMTPAPQPKPNIIQALGLVSRYTLLIGKFNTLCNFIVKP